MLWMRCFLGITYRCNLRCEHCYAGQRRNRADLEYKEVCRLVDELHRAGVMYLCYSHGENMLHPEFWKITKYIHDHEIYIVLMTNGMPIQRTETAHRLYDVGIRKIFVSLDSLNKERHERRRGALGCYERALRALYLLRDVGKFQLGISFVIDEYNWDEIDQVIDFALGEGLQRVNFLTIRPFKIIFLITIEKYRAVAKKLVDHEVRLRSRLRIQIHDPLILSLVDLSVYDSRTQESIVLENVCQAGRGMLSIAPDGTVRPCNFVPQVVGNIHDEPLTHILMRLEGLHARENAFPSWCAGCQRAPICRGGCKAFTATGDGREPGVDQRCLAGGLKLVSPCP